jgi:hypothetical protein
MGVPVVGSMSPWGRVEDVREFGDGVVFVSTAGHGGFWLSADRHRALQSRHGFKTFAGGAWYEEDCDAAVVVVAFSDLFDVPTVERATAAVLARPAYYGNVCEHWLFESVESWFAD